MFAALLASTLATVQQPVVLDLYRGCPLPVASPSSIRYWDVQDTVLDASSPEENFGAGFTLAGGKTRVVLLKFGDLDRVGGLNRKVVRASLVLTLAEGADVRLKSISRVLQPWGEGPYLNLSSILRAPAKGPNGQLKKKLPPPLSATWRERLAGQASWGRPGAQGTEDSAPIKGFSVSVENGKITVSGIESTVQEMLDRWYDNHGFALTFDSDTEILGSKNPTGRPELHLELDKPDVASGPDLSVQMITSTPEHPKNGEEVTWTGHVRNVGTAPEPGFSATWSIGERSERPVEVTQALAPGEETTLSVKRIYHESSDERATPITLRVMPKAKDVNPSNDFLEVWENARPISLPLPGASDQSGLDGLQASLRVWNEEVAPQSRFSFASEGVLRRLRLQSLAPSAATAEQSLRTTLKTLSVLAGAPELPALSSRPGTADGAAKVRGNTPRFPGLLGHGDTRWEGRVLGLVSVSNVPIPNPNVDDSGLEPTDLLSSFDVAVLNGADQVSPFAGMPKALAVRVMDLLRRPLVNSKFDFYQSVKGKISLNTPVFSLTSDSAGTIYPPKQGDLGAFGRLVEDGGNATFLVRTTSHGVDEWAWLDATEVLAAGARSGKPLAIMELQFNVTDAALDSQTDLALDRLVSDSAGDFPAKLAALIDGSDTTEAAVPQDKGGWVEIDLGRDRTIGEIRLVTHSSFWQQFDIQVYSTGQKPEEGTLWCKEIDWAWTAANRSDAADAASIAYRNVPQKIRYIRLLNRSGGPGSLGAIHVLPAVLTSP